MEEILTEYQKKNIKKREKLNFNEELIKSKTDIDRLRFNKNIRSQLDILALFLYENGVIFYGFSISMPFLDKDDPQLWYYTHLHVEGWVSTFKTEIELIEFCYISIELEKSSNLESAGLPTIHGILGIRSIIGQTDLLLNEIKKIFNIWKGIEFTVNNLINIKSIKKYWNYVIKENNFKFHRFQYFSDFYHLEYGAIMDLELQYDENHVAFDLVHNFDSKFSDIKGIKDINPLEQTVINYLVHIYMKDNNLFLYKNKLYKKLTDKFEFVGSIDFLSQNNIKIFEYLKLKFPQQLTGLKVPKLLAIGWQKFFDDIKKYNHYLPTITQEQNFIT